MSVTLQRISAGLPVIRFGDGSMERDYIHVENVAQQIARVAESGHQHDIYNIGSGMGHSVNDVLAIIREVTGVDFVVEERAVPASFPHSAVLNVNRFETEFGKPELTSIANGVASMWKELQEHVAS